MANELVDAVTATPAGPVTVGLGQSLDITGRFALNGPSGGTLLSRSMAWLHLSPGAPFSFDFELSPIEDTDYTKTCPASALDSIGAHVIRLQVFSIYDIPSQQTVASNDITVHVVAWREGEAPDTTHTEGIATPTTMTEGTATPTTMTEGTATPTTMTEGTATPTTMTEGS